MPPHLNARAIYGGDVALILLASPALLADLDDPIRRYLAVHPQLRLSVDGGVYPPLEQIASLSDGRFIF